MVECLIDRERRKEGEWLYKGHPAVRLSFYRKVKINVVQIHLNSCNLALLPEIWLCSYALQFASSSNLIYPISKSVHLPYPHLPHHLHPAHALPSSTFLGSSLAEPDTPTWYVWWLDTRCRTSPILDAAVAQGNKFFCYVRSPCKCCIYREWTYVLWGDLAGSWSPGVDKKVKTKLNFFAWHLPARDQNFSSSNQSNSRYLLSYLVSVHNRLWLVWLEQGWA